MNDDAHGVPRRRPLSPYRRAVIVAVGVAVCAVALVFFAQTGNSGKDKFDERFSRMVNSKQEAICADYRIAITVDDDDIPLSIGRFNAQWADEWSPASDFEARQVLRERC